MRFGVSVSLVKPGGIKTEIFKKMRKLENKTAAVTQRDATAMLKSAVGTDDVKELYREDVLIGQFIAKAIDADPNLPTTDLTDASIVHAVVSPYPKTRYLTAPDAQLFYLMDNWLPERVFDG